MPVVPHTPRLLLENGDWTPWETGLAAGIVRPDKARKSVEALGRRFRSQLGLRADPFTFRTSGSGVTEIKTSGIAGTVGVGELVFAIAPKFAPQGRGQPEWSASALLLMQYARKRDLALVKVQHLAVQRSSFVDLLAMAFADAVETAMADHMILRYRTSEQSLPVMRGRLNIARQLRTVFGTPHLLECDVDELDANNEFNGLLKWAAATFASAVRDPALRRKMSDMALRLPSLPDRRLALRSTRIQPPPQFRAWSDALDIASLLSSGLAHSSGAGVAAGYSFVFNMERLFEHFLEISLARAVGLLREDGVAARRQATTAYAHPQAGTSIRFYSRPDNLVTKHGAARVVVDAKYKRLSDAEGMKARKPVNADVYELVAAMTAHDCRHGLLVYPRVLGDTILGDDGLRTWTVSSFGTTLTISALALDLSGLRTHAHLQTIDKQLSDALGPMLRDIVTP